MDSIPPKQDISWHKSTEFLKATLKFHEEKARTPASLKDAKAMHTAMIEEISRDFRDKGISQRLEFTGSAYEGVKVAKCEGNDDLEFDVMMVLRVPRNSILRSDSLHGKAGFSFIKYSESNQVSSCWFTENCLSVEAEDCSDEGNRIVDASRTVNSFYGELQLWINESRKYKDQILLRRHGPAVQMDVFREKVTSDPPYYSVDVVPAIEIPELCPARLYVAKPLKNRGMPDSVTWRQLISRETEFRKGYSDSSVDEYTPSHLRCMQEFVSLLNTKYQFSLIGHEIDTDNGNDLEFKVLVVNKSHSSELQLDQVPEKPEFYWIVPKKNKLPSIRLEKSLKTCYRPCGMHLDSRRATTAFVKDLQDCIKNSTLLNGKVHIRRDGPVVRLLICEVLGDEVGLCGVQRSLKKPSSIPKPLYYVDLIFAHEIDGKLYTARPTEEKNARDAKSWRMSFSLEEKKELYGNYGCLKKVFRVCKVLRNAEVGLAQLTSYHLKTTLLGLKCKSDWSDRCIGERLMNVIGELERCLERRNLSHFFLNELNLTSGMINDCMKHMQNRLFRLYVNKRHILKALGVPWDIPRITRAVKIIERNLTTTISVESQSMDPNSVIRSELDEVFCSCSLSKTLEGGYFLNEYTVVRTGDDDSDDVYAMFVINDHENELQTQETHCASFEEGTIHYILVSRKPVTSKPTKLGLKMTDNYVDADKTASFVADFLTDCINENIAIGGVVHARAEGTLVKIRRSHRLLNFSDLIVIPAYKTQDKLFVADEGNGYPLVWRQSYFEEEQRKFQQADCGIRVLHMLKFLRRQESGLSGLTTRHFRAALLWELHDEPDWAEGKMAERLLDVMDRLYFAVTVNRLEDYFSPDVNILSDVNPSSLQDLRKYLSKFCENEDEQVRILKSQALIGGVPMRQLVDQWRI